MKTKKQIISEVTLDMKVSAQGDFDYRSIETVSGVMLYTDKIHGPWSHDDSDGFLEIETVEDTCKFFDCSLEELLEDAWVWDYIAS